MATSRASSPDRRVHPRFAANELRGLYAARVKYGQGISVINLSAGGIWFETTGRLTPESIIVLEFLGPANALLVPSRVLRCQSFSTIERGRAKGACAFKRLLRLKDLVTGTTARARARPLKAALPTDDASSACDSSLAASPWQQVVGKYRDGRLVHGYTSDFSPVKSYMRVSPTPAAKESLPVSLSELDALFFLRDPLHADGGNAEIARESAAPYGRRVALVLPSGKELIGSTLNYSRDGHGFFIHPSDSDFGVARVFVTPGGIRNLRFL
jgi:hypothetical protein